VGYDDFLETIINYCGPIRGKNILDLATGTANVALAAARAAKSNCHIAGADLAVGMLEIAKSKAEAAGLSDCIKLIRASGEVLPFPKNTFQIVTCSLAFHHMPVIKVLNELVRVLIPEGRLVIADMAAPSSWRTPWGRIISPVYQLAGRIKEKRPIRSGSKMYTLREMRKLLVDAGFTVEDAKSCSKGYWRPELIIVSASIAAQP
jgi:ubiquinone/menaquinone biosynthesis C-methylase UbiE